MLRLTITLAVLIATFATSSELMAQRRAPLRNFARQFGKHWSAGYHVRNPGPQTGYYSPWSQTNTPNQHWRPAAESNATLGNEPQGFWIQPNHSISDQNSVMNHPAARRLPDSHSAGSWFQGNNSPEFRIQSGVSSWTRNSSDTIRSRDHDFNQQMQPWHHADHSESARSIDHASSQFIPALNDWDARFDQQFENSRPFVPQGR